MSTQSPGESRLAPPLPDDLKALFKAEAACKGFGTVSESMRSVIREAREQAERRSQVDALLLEGLDSGPTTPLTAADWETIHQKLEKRHAARQGKPDIPEKTGRS
jgi:antitoxin ParD1/3/4